MSELGDKRSKFTKYVAKLINYMIAQGYEPRLGKDGVPHMKNSLHYEGLAVDIDLIKDGVYMDATSDHEEFGRYWESLDEDCSWGGWFNDGNHYSVKYMGRK